MRACKYLGGFAGGGGGGGMRGGQWVLHLLIKKWKDFAWLSITDTLVVVSFGLD